MSQTDIIVAKTIWGEAEGESALGQIGVGCVIRNRVNDPAWWGSTYEEVCLKSAQFSCWNERYDKLMKLDLSADVEGKQCLWIAYGVVKNLVHDVTNGADHYLAKWMIEKGVAPRWAIAPPICIIEHHLFYKLGPGG